MGLIEAKEFFDNAVKTSTSQWKKWFAWYPIIINEKRVWCRTVYRRRTKVRMISQGYPGPRIMYTAWEYGNLFDVLSKG